jgi:hypothetical protein
VAHVPRRTGPRLWYPSRVSAVLTGPVDPVDPATGSVPSSTTFRREGSPPISLLPEEQLADDGSRRNGLCGNESL